MIGCCVLRQKPSESQQLRLVDGMMVEQSEAAEQIRQLRHAEKVKADQRLQDKMQKKKVRIGRDLTTFMS